MIRDWSFLILTRRSVLIKQLAYFSREFMFARKYIWHKLLTYRYKYFYKISVDYWITLLFKRYIYIKKFIFNYKYSVVGFPVIHRYSNFFFIKSTQFLCITNLWKYHVYIYWFTNWPVLLLAISPWNTSKSLYNLTLPFNIIVRLYKLSSKLKYLQTVHLHLRTIFTIKLNKYFFPKNDDLPIQTKKFAISSPPTFQSNPLHRVPIHLLNLNNDNFSILHLQKNFDYIYFLNLNSIPRIKYKVNFSDFNNYTSTLILPIIQSSIENITFNVNLTKIKNYRKFIILLLVYKLHV